MALFLCLLALAPLTSGCARPEPVSETLPETAAVPAEEPVSVPEGPASEYTPPPADYKDSDFGIAALSFPGNESWKAMDYCEVTAEEITGETLNDAIYERRIRIEDELRVRFTLFPLTDRGDAGRMLKKEVMSGDSDIRLALINGTHLAGLTYDRMLLDQKGTDLVDFTHSWWDPREVNDLAIGDSLYASAGDISLYLDFSQITWFFNKKLTEDNGLDDPYQLVYDNKWTLDRAVGMAESVAADLNGDGRMSVKDDCYGFMCEPLTMLQAVYAAGIPLVRRDDSGFPAIALEPYLERADSVARILVPFMNNQNVSLLSTNLPRTAGNASGHFTYFLPTFLEDRALFYSNQLLVTLNLREMEADFGILPYPKYDENQEFHSPIGPYWATFAVVPASNTAYFMTGDVMEALGYYGQQLVIPAFVDKSVRYRSLRDENSSRMLDIIFANRTYDLAMIYDCGNLESMFGDLASGNSVNVASFYRSIEYGAQKKLDLTVSRLMR